MVKVDSFKIVECGTIPEQMRDGVVYRSKRYGTAVHLCACGCGRKVVTPDRMGWKVDNCGGVPTIRPSIGNFQFPCGSHYFITGGKVEWCP